MKKIIAALGMSLTALLAIPAQGQTFESGDTVVTLVNLHHDPARPELYTLNYQLPMTLPMCTEVSIVKRKKKRVVLSIEGREYEMDYDKHHKKAGVSFDELLGRYFGSECEADKVASLSEIDQKGIRKGQPYVGMSKQGILYAMGRPPSHANPDLDVDMWMYWKNRFKRQAIHFDDDGLVEQIRL